MLSAGEFITIDVLQSFTSELFITEFLRILRENGLGYTASDRIDFTTTPDKTGITAGRQSEKYYGTLVD